jgi:hypothetical protein
MLVLEARQVDVALRMAMPSDLLVPSGTGGDAAARH